MKDFLNHLESFIKSYGFYLALALLLCVVIILVVDICVVASVNKKIKKLEKKTDKEQQPESVSLSCEKTNVEIPKVSYDRPRDEKGRFIKANK